MNGPGLSQPLAWLLISSMAAAAPLDRTPPPAAPAARGSFRTRAMRVRNASMMPSGHPKDPPRATPFVKGLEYPSAPGARV